MFGFDALEFFASLVCSSGCSLPLLGRCLGRVVQIRSCRGSAASTTASDSFGRIVGSASSFLAFYRARPRSLSRCQSNSPREVRDKLEDFPSLVVGMDIHRQTHWDDDDGVAEIEARSLTLHLLTSENASKSCLEKVLSVFA